MEGEDALKWKPDRWLAPLPSTMAESLILGIYSILSVEYIPRVPEAHLFLG